MVDAPVPLPREAALLLCCARFTLQPRHEAVLDSLLRTPLDWAAVLRLAGRHGLVPLLARHAARFGDAAPAGFRDAVRRSFALNAQYNRKLMAELRTILLRFEQHGIPALPYKGPVLAHRLYGDTAFREMSDLDVMVAKDDVPGALALLRDLGYHSPHHPTPRQHRALLRADNNYALCSPETRVPVELHWAFAHRHAIEALGLDELDTDRRTVEGMEVRWFAPEDLLLVLCFHGTRHMWERLAWLCDVNQLLHAEQIHWDRAFARARRFGVRRALGLGLALAHRVLNAPLAPEVIRRAESDRAVRALAARVTERMFDGDSGPSFSLGFRFHGFQLRSMDRPGDRARYVGRSLMVPQPEDWRAVPLPDPLFPLYYLIRPVRLALRYAS
jgi:hypothetical protein